MSQPEEQPTIVCLNYCRTDPESGYCLTCGRPPVPVTGISLSAPLFGRMTLAGLQTSGSKGEVPEEK
jgi:hypothetical protein